jgi:hypothetical protein
MAMQTKSSQNIPRGRSFEQKIPPLLRPVIRAYVLGYASSTAPRLLTLLLTHLSRRRKNIDEKPDDYFLLSLIRILKGGLEVQRFPTFCAALVGGSTLLEARDQHLPRLFSWLILADTFATGVRTSCCRLITSSTNQVSSHIPSLSHSSHNRSLTRL